MTTTSVRGCALALLLSAVPIACDRPSSGERVEIDLTAVESGVVNGQRVPLPIADGDGSRRIRQEGKGTIDLLVRLPAESELRFGLSPEVGADAFAVSIEGEGQSDTLRPEKAGTGGWRASLARFDRELVRLRLENRADAALEWTAPQIVGMGDGSRPILDPAPRAPDPPINVLLYVVDGLRADHLSAYGYGRATSPVLQELADRGTLFLNAYAAASSTAPSIRSLLSADLASPAEDRLAAGEVVEPVLAELFQAAGYRTAAFQANFTLVRGLGYGRGFEQYHVLKRDGPDGPRPLQASELHDRVRGWLKVEEDRPFFLYVQAMDVRPPHDAPAPDAGKREEGAPTEASRYDGAITYVDHEIGSLLATLRELGLAERTAVVVTADLGALLGKPRPRSGFELSEEVVRVPLIIMLPWRKGGERIEEVVSLMDVGPTLLDLAGLAVPESVLGRSLLRAEDPLRPRAALGEGDAGSAGYMRAGPWKLIRDADGSRLFHLPSDPQEERNVVAEHPLWSEYLLLELSNRLPSSESAGRPPALAEALPEEDRKELEEGLKALGYVE